MFQSQEAIEITQKYQAGERDFRNMQLRRADLKGLDLSKADLREVDLSCADLREVNLSCADLRGAYLNEADFKGANLSEANLQGASLTKTHLIEVNFYQANLKEVYLTGSFATKSNFREANFEGAFLTGAKLSGADLQDASYDSKTRFDGTFDPIKAGMKKKEIVEKAPEEPEIQEKITIEKLLEIFNHLSQISSRYLGNTMTLKYWEASRPNIEWLKQFQVNSSGKMTFSGDGEKTINSLQLQWAQMWFKSFVKSCSQIVQNFPKMIDPNLIELVIAPEIANI